MKKILFVTILILILCAGGMLGYINYKKSSTETRVIKYLKTEENVSEEKIDSTEPFLANLPGDRNFMVSVSLKGDQNLYYYYENEDNQIVLESYTDENGYEHVHNAK
ncbi:hypothetical protein GCM10010954_38990 [Halobacillus andaensis]|uniref:DUF3139 domain-containing protein n=1 Tax=Halobacillus andaensis TaxID=1176239 RepID=A0A917BCA0_HALAA|nr:DUF3139 domain-containing protein [Halobacillus andaensis]MBP2006728.1 flagellar basal body-associated protein FliL [Halobacillus andaensis]GGF36196.1 hypothetical protein GCM10010954_38990 [Halobacillus andaensis]